MARRKQTPDAPRMYHGNIPLDSEHDLFLVG
jgi:hypothetical protein